MPGPAYRIETERLILRCWDPADAAEAHEVIHASLEELRPWIPWAKEYPKSLDDQVRVLRGWRARFDLDQDYIYAIRSKGDDRLLGGVGLHTRLGPRALELGYWLRTDAYRQGYITEAAAAAVRVGFEIVGAAHIEIRCDPRNVRSGAVAARLNFRMDGVLRRRASDVGDRLGDLQVWSLFADEFPGSPVVRVPIRAYDPLGNVIAVNAPKL